MILEVILKVEEIECDTSRSCTKNEGYRRKSNHYFPLLPWKINAGTFSVRIVVHSVVPG